MRWLLVPLVLLALLAPSAGCEPRALLFRPDGTYLVPPVPPLTPGEVWGTDLDGRNLGCLYGRGLRRSLEVALAALGLGVLPGVVLGLLLGARRIAVGFPGEIVLLAGLVLLLGPGSYRLVLGLGFALYVARVVSARVAAVTLEPFVEGARALGGSGWHVVRRHLWPHVRPTLPGLLTTAVGVSLVWTAELGMLGFYDRGGSVIVLGDPQAGVATNEFIPTSPDLAQVISYQRWSWLSSPLFLAVPVLLLTLLNLALSDLGRVVERRFDRTPRG